MDVTISNGAPLTYRLPRYLRRKSSKRSNAVHLNLNVTTTSSLITRRKARPVICNRRNFKYVSLQRTTLRKIRTNSATVNGTIKRSGLVLNARLTPMILVITQGRRSGLCELITHVGHVRHTRRRQTALSKSGLLKRVTTRARALTSNCSGDMSFRKIVNWKL